jgi:DNA invertase Pin-like site-specific DNA recombinase
MGPTRSHVRYPFYNAFIKNGTKKKRKEGKPHGKPPPSRYNVEKKEDNC